MRLLALLLAGLAAVTLAAPVEVTLTSYTTYPSVIIEV